MERLAHILHPLSLLLRFFLMVLWTQKGHKNDHGVCWLEKSEIPKQTDHGLVAAVCPARQRLGGRSQRGDTAAVVGRHTGGGVVATSGVATARTVRVASSQGERDMHTLFVGSLHLCLQRKFLTLNRAKRSIPLTSENHYILKA